jgi:hypothetical protein
VLLVQVLLVAMAVRVQHLLLRVQVFFMLAVAVAVDMTQEPAALVALVVGHRVLVGLAQEIVELQILAVVVVAQLLRLRIQEVLAVLVLLSFQFQQQITAEQQQVHQQLQHRAQIQS